MKSLSDKELIHRIKQDNIQAFNELFYRYHKKIFNFCLKTLFYSAEAEEITQEVFIALWTNRKSIDEGRPVSHYFWHFPKFNQQTY